MHSDRKELTYRSVVAGIKLGCLPCRGSQHLIKFARLVKRTLMAALVRGNRREAGNCPHQAANAQVQKRRRTKAPSAKPIPCSAPHHQSLLRRGCGELLQHLDEMARSDALRVLGQVHGLDDNQVL